MWKDLTMGQKSEVMRLAVQQGFSDLNNIREMYDTATSVYNTSSNNTYDNVPYNPSPKDVRYADGGYLDWKNRIKAYKGLDIDNDNAYDYEGFYNSNPSRAYDMLKEHPKAHFTDEFKTAYHPTFSTQSKYSGLYHPVYNPYALMGGTWENNDKTYRPALTPFTSTYQRENYLRPEGYLRELTPTEYSTSLPMITVTPNGTYYAEGGPLGNIYQGKGNKSQKLSRQERENIAMWTKGKPFFNEVKGWNLGLDDAALAGIVGNIALESSFDPKAEYKSHYGYLQNQPEIRDYIIKHYGGYGHKEQMQYLQDGLRGKLRGASTSMGKQMQERFNNYLKAVKDVKDPVKASQLWELHYEKSGGQAMGKRQRYAEYFFNQVNPRGKFKSAQKRASDNNLTYIDPNTSIFDALTMAGVDFSTRNPSGYRTPQQQSRFKTKNSQHTRKRDDGTAYALDIVGDFDKIKKQLTHPALQAYFKANGFGVFDETLPENLAKSGGTGRHFHIGFDSYGGKGTMTSTYNNWVKQYGSPISEDYVARNTPQADYSSPIYHHPVQDIAWTPPVYSTPPTESIAPAIMETPNRPIIVDALAEDTTPTVNFDKMWASIFPQVEEPTPSVVTPYEQFMTLQSRPRHTAEPIPVVAPPTPIVDNSYLLFEPMSTLGYGGVLYKEGGTIKGSAKDGSRDINYNPYFKRWTWGSKNALLPLGHRVKMSDGYEYQLNSDGTKTKIGKKPSKTSQAITELLHDTPNNNIVEATLDLLDGTGGYYNGLTPYLQTTIMKNAPLYAARTGDMSSLVNDDVGISTNTIRNNPELPRKLMPFYSIDTLYLPEQYKQQLKILGKGLSINKDNVEGLRYNEEIPFTYDARNHDMQIRRNGDSYYTDFSDVFDTNNKFFDSNLNPIIFSQYNIPTVFTNDTTLLNKNQSLSDEIGKSIGRNLTESWAQDYLNSAIKNIVENYK